MLALKSQRKKTDTKKGHSYKEDEDSKDYLPAGKETTGHMHTFMKQHLLLMKTAQCYTESMNGTKLRGGRSTPAISQTERRILTWAGTYHLWLAVLVWVHWFAPGACTGLKDCTCLWFLP